MEIVSLAIWLGCALVFLLLRPKVPARLAAFLGVIFLLIGGAEFMSRNGRYYGFVGAAWLLVGAIYLLCLIPGAETMFRSRKGDA